MCLIEIFCVKSGLTEPDLCSSSDTHVARLGFTVHGAQRCHGAAGCRASPPQRMDARIRRGVVSGKWHSRRLDFSQDFFFFPPFLKAASSLKAVLCLCTNTSERCGDNLERRGCWCAAPGPLSRARGQPRLNSQGMLENIQ